MVAYSVVPAERRHVDELVAGMRPEDAAEVAALGMTPAQALSKCLAGSRDTKVGLADGRVLAIFGIASLPEYPEVTYIWLLSAKEADQHKIAFARWSKRFVDEQKGKHRILGNFVDARYKKAVEWVRWLGFNVYPAAPLGESGVPFHWFDMRTD